MPPTESSRAASHVLRPVLRRIEFWRQTTINAYNPIGAPLGTLQDGMGNPIVNQGLWGLAFGNGGPGFDPNALYFTAGIPGPDNIEDHGLFGEIIATPEPSALLPIVIVASWLLRRRHRRQL